MYTCVWCVHVFMCEWEEGGWREREKERKRERERE